MTDIVITLGDLVNAQYTCRNDCLRDTYPEWEKTPQAKLLVDFQGFGFKCLKQLYHRHIEAIEAPFRK